MIDTENNIYIFFLTNCKKTDADSCKHGLLRTLCLSCTDVLRHEGSHRLHQGTQIYNLAGITVAYALSPIDLIPDFIPIPGYLDDVILLPMLVALTIKFIPKSVLERARKESEDLWKDGKPKKWYYAIPIIIIWIIILIILLKIIF